jgi:hypothetical protein
MMQVHYARGSTVAEAFFQSVYSPYQLLIVGDPLCRPWANIPEVTVSGARPGATVTGILRLQPAARFPSGSTIDHFELFVDSQRGLIGEPGNSLELDTSKIPDGYHEFRVVAVEKGSIRSQGEQILPLVTANHKRTIEATAAPANIVPAGQPLVITAKAPGCVRIAVIQGTRGVGVIAGEQGRVEIKPSMLGAGPVRLQVFGVGAGGIRTSVIAKPLEFVVKDDAASAGP